MTTIQRSALKGVSVLIIGWAMVIATAGAEAAPATGVPDLEPMMAALKLSQYPPTWSPPDFHTTDIEGKAYSLDSLKGNLILLNFWATWCKPCLDEMPAFEQLHREFSASGLRVVAVNIEEEPDRIRKFGDKLKLTFPLLLDADGKITKAYGVIGLPSSFIIGRDGKPIALAVGPREWYSDVARRLIGALLAQPPSG